MVPRSIAEWSRNREESIERDEKKIEDTRITHEIIETQPELTGYVSDVPSEEDLHIIVANLWFLPFSEIFLKMFSCFPKGTKIENNRGNGVNVGKSERKQLTSPAKDNKSSGESRWNLRCDISLVLCTFDSLTYHNISYGERE